MANSPLSLSKPNPLTFSINNPYTIPLQTSLPFNCTPFHHKPTRRSLPASSVSVPPISIDYLSREFGGNGVSFTELGEGFVVNMAVGNGSTAKVMVPSGLITSYKPRLWHGGTQELLHTCVSEDLVVQGGVSLALGCQGHAGFSWSPTTWSLKDVTRNESRGVQVEVISRDPNNEVEIQYNITLQPDSLTSQYTLSNLTSSILELRGSIITNLSVSTPDATYAVGLEGSNFFDRPPIQSQFSITPPYVAPKKEKPNIFQNLFSSNGNTNAEAESKSQEEEGEESSNYKHLTEKMSRIYTSAPRNFTIIDRGKRNSVDIMRRGLDEVYIHSPGSTYEWYGEYAYVCVGQCAMLKSIVLGPGDVWRGEQRLYNPNI